MFYCSEGLMMNKEEIISRINKILIEEFEIEPKQINPQARLKQDLDIDSLDLVDIVVIIEKNFGIKVKGEEMVEIKILQEFYDYIINRIHPN